MSRPPLFPWWPLAAWQMLFDYAQAKAGQTVLVHGAAGNVGAYAVQLAKHAGLHAFATVGPDDLEYVRNLGADAVPPADIVIDTVGGDTRESSFGVLKPGGILVSVVSPFPENTATSRRSFRVHHRGSNHRAAEHDRAIVKTPEDWLLR